MSTQPHAGGSPIEDPEDPPPSNFTDFDYEDARPDVGASALWIRGKKIDAGVNASIDPQEDKVETFQFWTQTPDQQWHEYLIAPPLPPQTYINSCTFTVDANGQATCSVNGSELPPPIAPTNTFPNPPWQS